MQINSLFTSENSEIREQAVDTGRTETGTGKMMSAYFKRRMAEIKANPALVRGSKTAGQGSSPKLYETAPFIGTRKGYIYFAVAGNEVKIGFATNPNERLASIQTGNPNKVHIEEAFHSYFEAERMVHERFAEHRIRGEWFQLVEDIEELWDDIWDYQGCNSSGDTGKEFVANMPDVFFDLDAVAKLLANIGVYERPSV